MKKIALLALFVGLGLAASAQYKPTKNDLGKDCATENGKLGTWKNVTVTESTGNSNSRGTANSSSNSRSVGAEATGSLGVNKSTKVEGGLNASHQSSNNNTTSKSNTKSSSTTRTYQDIQCVEDKNAKKPQMTPVRW